MCRSIFIIVVVVVVVKHRPSATDYIWYFVVCRMMKTLPAHKWVTMSLLVFTALHGMQTRSSDENSVCRSVRLSVRPSHA